MKEVIISCSGGKHLGKKIAKKLKASYGETIIERFPDTEIKVRINAEIKNKKVFFVQSFYKDKNLDINDKLIELLFAAHTAKSLGAKKINLISPYFAYLRQDMSFKKGEAVANRILVNLCKIFNKVYIVEPHLHRLHSFKEFFPNAVRISLADETANYIKRKIKNPVIVGPDIESEQWVIPVAKKLNAEHKILKKQRFNSRKVKIKGKKTKNKNIVIIDDIISSGHTLIEASKLTKGNIYFIGMHGLFAEGALSKLKKIGKVITTNTIPNKAGKIDCANAIVKKIKK